MEEKHDTHLYLLTESFPYGKGEKTFIEPELKYLKEIFQITIITSAMKSDVETKAYLTDCGENIEIIHYDKGKIKKGKVLKYLFSFLFSSYGVKEIFDIICHRKKIFARFKKSLYFWAESECFRNWINQKKLVNQEEIIFYSYWYDYHVLGLIINREKKWKNSIKILTRTHGVDLYDERVNRAGRQPFRDFMDRNVDKVVFASNYGYQYYMNKLKRVPGDKYFISKLGVPASGINKSYLKLKKNRMHIVSCSNVILLKRINLIIDGLALINDIEIQWTHFGSGEKLEEIILYAEKKLAGNHVDFKFMGYVERKSIYEYYATNYVDLFITASESEGGCPVSIQEAMAFGIPIIGTSVGGITEMIHNNGILLDSFPYPKQIADAIRKIYFSNENEIICMRRASFELWQKEYVDSHNAQRFVKYLVDWLR